MLGYLVLLGVEFAGGLLFGGAVARQGGSQLMLTGEVITFVAGVAAGAVAASIATARPLLHALVLGAAVVCVMILGAALSKRPPTPGIPSWYPYAAALLTGAGTFVGGALAMRKKPTA